MFRSFFLLIIVAVFLPACDKAGNESLQVPQFVTRQQDTFVLTNGTANLTVSPAKGGRIVSLKLNDFEFLATESQVNSQPNAFGSVLWSSPQSEWSWPPLAELNNQPYTVTCDSNQTAIILSSQIEPKTRYQFIKSYSLGDRPQTFKIRYKIINHSDQTKHVAAIENTRVKPQGIAFFPKGDTEPNSGIFYPLQVEILDGIVWHQFEPEKIRQDHHKVMMDGKEGWLAYSKGQHLLIHRFKDSPADQAPETEREIEIFGHMDRNFAEIKHQSALHHLAPGESFEWEVEWQVKKLPKDIDLSLGSEDLIDAARDID